MLHNWQDLKAEHTKLDRRIAQLASRVNSVSEDRRRHVEDEAQSLVVGLARISHSADLV